MSLREAFNQYRAYLTWAEAEKASFRRGMPTYDIKTREVRWVPQRAYSA